MPTWRAAMFSTWMVSVLLCSLLLWCWTDQNQLAEEMVYLASTSTSQSITEGGPSTVSWNRNQGGILFAALLLGSKSASFSLQPGPPALGCYHLQCAEFSATINQDSSSQAWPQASLIRAIPYLRVPQATLCVKLACSPSPILKKGKDLSIGPLKWLEGFVDIY